MKRSFTVFVNTLVSGWFRGF